MEHFPDSADEGEGQPESISKTQRKKEMTELQKLGQELTTLNKKQLGKLPLPESLLSAIKEYQRLPNSNEAKRRQMQFIGRLMRDAEHDEIQTALNRLRAPDREQLRRSQNIELWCDRLLAGDEQDITRLLEQHPGIERQSVRQLVRNHRKQGESEVRTYRRKLLDLLKEHL